MRERKVKKVKAKRRKKERGRKREKQRKKESVRKREKEENIVRARMTRFLV